MRTGQMQLYVFAVLGLMGVWPIFRSDGVSSLMANGYADMYAMRAVHLLFVLGTLAAALVLAVYWRATYERLVRRPGLLVGCSALASAAAAVLWAADGLGSVLGPALGCAAGAVYGVWAALILIAWGRIGCRIDGYAQRAAVLVVSFVLGLVPSILGVAVSETAFSACIAAAPLISGVCCWAVFRTVAWPKVQGGGWAALAADFAGFSRGSTLRASLRRIGLLVALMLVGSFIRGLLNSGSISTQPSTSSIYTHAVTVAIAVLFVFMLVRGRGSADTYSALFIALSVAMLVGLFMLAILDSPEGAVSPLARGVVIAGRSCMGLLLWIMLAASVGERPQTAAAMFGLLYVCVEAFASLVSYVLMPAVSLYLNVDLGSHLLTCSLLTAFALVLITYAFLYEDRAGPAGAGEAAGTREALSLEVLAARANLTDRERDVAALIAQGHSARRISETLGLSVNTVQGYSKGAYRKLGIHSRQELIDLIAAGGR